MYTLNRTESGYQGSPRDQVRDTQVGLDNQNGR